MRRARQNWRRLICGKQGDFRHHWKRMRVGAVLPNTIGEDWYAKSKVTSDTIGRGCVLTRCFQTQLAKIDMRKAGDFRHHWKRKRVGAVLPGTIGED